MSDASKKQLHRQSVHNRSWLAFPGTVHIDEQKDFTPVIEKALELGGYKDDQTFTGINGGTQVTTGFGHSAILSHADTVIEAVNQELSVISSWLPAVMVPNRAEITIQNL